MDRDAFLQMLTDENSWLFLKLPLGVDILGVVAQFPDEIIKNLKKMKGFNSTTRQWYFDTISLIFFN